MSERYAVATPTQDEFSRLMELYEKVGWKWADNSQPTNNTNLYKKYKEDSNIGFINYFGFGPSIDYKNDGYTTLSVDEAEEKLREMYAEKFIGNSDIQNRLAFEVNRPILAPVNSTLQIINKGNFEASNIKIFRITENQVKIISEYENIILGAELILELNLNILTNCAAVITYNNLASNILYCCAYDVASTQNKVYELGKLQSYYSPSRFKKLIDKISIQNQIIGKINVSKIINEEFNLL